MTSIYSEMSYDYTYDITWNKLEFLQWFMPLFIRSISQHPYSTSVLGSSGFKAKFTRNELIMIKIYKKKNKKQLADIFFFFFYSKSLLFANFLLILSTGFLQTLYKVWIFLFLGLHISFKLENRQLIPWHYINVDCTAMKIMNSIWIILQFPHIQIQ